jgi:hypothetical protein
VKAARVLAGGVTIHATASAAGISYLHLAAVERGEQPLLPTDAVDLSRVLPVPASWLRDGWDAANGGRRSPDGHLACSSMGERTDGDRLFEDYLRHTGVAVPEHEPDLGIGVRIEYLLDVGGERCATEVKEFDPSSWPIRSGTISEQERFKPHRTQIHQAARKLRRAKDLGHPLVVVLTDPHRALFGLLTPQDVVAAMMGDLSVRVPVSPVLGGPVGPASFAAGRNGELRHDHPYVSAVTVINNESGYLRAFTFITKSAEAVPLSPVFFRAPDDWVWEYNDEHSHDAGAYEIVYPPE